MLASATERCRSILKGTMLPSPTLRSHNKNTVMSTLVSTRSKIILQLAHAYIVPPHCNASTRVTVMGMLMPKPTQSIFLRISLLVKCAFPDL